MLNSFDKIVDSILLPVNDVIMFPIAVKENPQQAVEGFTRSALRITIAALGVFTAYTLLCESSYLKVSFVARAVVTVAAVCISSFPAGTIMWGCGMISGGYMVLTIAMNEGARTLFELASNLLEASLGAAIISVGAVAIYGSAKLTCHDRFIGCLEPIINRIAQETGFVAGFIANPSGYLGFPEHWQG